MCCTMPPLGSLAEITNPDISVLEQCMTEQKYVRGAMTRAMLYLQVSVRCAGCVRLRCMRLTLGRPASVEIYLKVRWLACVTLALPSRDCPAPAGPCCLFVVRAQPCRAAPTDPSAASPASLLRAAARLWCLWCAP